LRIGSIRFEISIGGLESISYSWRW